MRLHARIPPPADSFEHDLMAARAGSNEALGRLLERFRPYLLRIANDELDSDLHPKAGPSDLVQQSFLEAHQSFDDFRGSGREELMGWLRGVLRHNLADARAAFHETAKRQLKNEELLDAAHAGPLRAKLTADTPSPLERAIAGEEAQALRQALDRVPADYRQVLDLRHREGRSFVEIGALLGRSPDAVRKLWFRAVECLRHELRGRHEPE